ncbi:hypothetical protein J3R82DRAFT_2183 [Butyriboletus roseoflavus]|nr:hypothetical protein J3R82DRAFT_2183 [Butyriboletus roseoflavus]
MVAQKKVSQSNKVNQNRFNEESNDSIITKLSKLGASKSNKANKGSSDKPPIISKQSKSGGKAKVNKGSSNKESNEPPVISKQSKLGPSMSIKMSEGGTVLMKVSNPGEEHKG